MADAAAVPAIRAAMDRHVGVVRDGAGLEAAIAALAPHALPAHAAWAGPVADMALAALLVAVAARDRRESRGGHYRSDHPAPDPAGHPGTLTLADAVGAALPVHAPLKEAAP